MTGHTDTQNHAHVHMPKASEASLSAQHVECQISLQEVFSDAPYVARVVWGVSKYQDVCVSPSGHLNRFRPMNFSQNPLIVSSR